MASGIALALPFDDFMEVIGSNAPTRDVVMPTNLTQVNIWCTGSSGNILVTTRNGEDRILQMIVGQSIPLRIEKIRAGAGNTARGVYVGIAGRTAK